MPQTLDYLPETASQTAGPYVHIGLIPHQAGFDIFRHNFDHRLAGPDVPGERIVIEGLVIDGSGSPVRDALLEIWQADADGHYSRPDRPAAAGFRGWGRAGTDFDSGLYRFETIKPGRVTGRNGRIMAPHVNFWIVARGINIGLNSRMYFSDEAAANAVDPVWNLIELERRRATLLGRRSLRDGEVIYRFDIVLQGENETVFLDV